MSITPSVADRPTLRPDVRARVLLADDHAILREGLAWMVAAHAGLEVVGQARGGREAVQMAQQLQPDVLVLDVSMPDLGGAEVAEQVRATCPGTKIIALTRHSDPGYVARMIKAGVHGYVVKRSASDMLLAALAAVMDGGTYFDPAVSATFIARAVDRAPGARARSPSPHAPLSEREEQVLRLIAWGKSNKEVAAQLGISVKTAEFYKANALEKLHLRSRTDILRHALSQKWLGEDQDPE